MKLREPGYETMPPREDCVKIRRKIFATAPAPMRTPARRRRCIDFPFL